MKKITKQFSILMTVFVTGAALLIIEILAIRILSPYSGNTIYTFSSVISIVLASLSLGYYLGGVLADRYPQKWLFYTIVMISGISILSIYLIMITILPNIGYKLSYVNGPLILSLLTFSIPSLLLGILSPFAIVLCQKCQSTSIKESVAISAGKVYFWSTLGGIAGSLSTSFILIPNHGISSIINTLGFALIFIGLLGLLINKLEKKFIIYSGLLLALMYSIYSNFSKNKNNTSIIYKQDGVYEKIAVYDDVFQDKKVRILRQDRSISGAMDLDTGESAMRTLKYYVLYKLFNPNIKRALVLGGGSYLVPKMLLKESSSIEIDVAEIEPSLFDISKKYFYLSNDVRLHNYIIDGRRFLQNTNTKYDLIFSDAFYSYFSVPIHFTTKEFFQLVKQHLNQDGIFILNLVDELTEKEHSFIFSEIKTLQKVFQTFYLFAVDSPTSPNIQNIIFIGYNGTKELHLDDEFITNNQDLVIKTLPDKLVKIQNYNLDHYPILTDDYAPVEYLIGKSLEKIKAIKTSVTSSGFPPLP